MIYDDYDNEKKNDDYESGYVNVGSSGNNAANRYEETGKEEGYTSSAGSSSGTYGSTGNNTAGGYGSSASGTYRSSAAGTGGGYGSPNSGTGSYGGAGTYRYGGSYQNQQARPHYTSYQEANYREPVRHDSPINNTGSAPKKKGGFFKKAVAAIVVGVLLGGSAAGAFYGVYKLTGMEGVVATIGEAKQVAEDASRAAATVAKESGTVQTKVASRTDSDTELSGSEEAGVSGVSQVVADTMPSVVAITNAMTVTGQTWWGQTIERTGESAGSGIIVGESDDELLIVTNHHVISDATTLSVQFVDGESAEANLKGQDEESDIAVIAVSKSDLKNDTANKIKVATLGDSDSLEVGEQVIAIGNAMGYGQSTTTGIISALHRETELTNGKHELIQTDAAINPGNSGGALLNMRGELIGINEAKAGQVLSNGLIVEGMGYAIPISTVQPIIDELMNKETKTKASDDKQSYLGIGGVDVTEEVSGTYDIPEGIYVAQVESGTAADKAGLERGDVITKFDGQSVGSMEELKNLMQYYEAGTTVDLIVKKQTGDGYKEETVTITLGKRPSDEAQ